MRRATLEEVIRNRLGIEYQSKSDNQFRDHIKKWSQNHLDIRNAPEDMLRTAAKQYYLAAKQAVACEEMILNRKHQSLWSQERRADVEEAIYQILCLKQVRHLERLHSKPGPCTGCLRHMRQETSSASAAGASPPLEPAVEASRLPRIASDVQRDQVEPGPSAAHLPSGVTGPALGAKDTNDLGDDRPENQRKRTLSPPASVAPNKRPSHDVGAETLDLSHDSVSTRPDPEFEAASSNGRAPRHSAVPRSTPRTPAGQHHSSEALDPIDSTTGTPVIKLSSVERPEDHIPGTERPSVEYIERLWFFQTGEEKVEAIEKGMEVGRRLVKRWEYNSFEEYDTVVTAELGQCTKMLEDTVKGMYGDDVELCRTRIRDLHLAVEDCLFKHGGDYLR
ncbi:hypothetical protein H2200_003173 [Cladophialophora chaetospira]|uniref:Uncharacterized protein n=1 Tax=Cladophialophora chaetospira TaxID=386627 RepID=A0AA38XHJ9_9EURO|nr:hypothetical protein H2200_003173 [Cladophialophora chaetospira]